MCLYTAKQSEAVIEELGIKAISHKPYRDIIQTTLFAGIFLHSFVDVS